VVEPHPTVDEFRVLLESLHLPSLLQGCERCDLRQTSRSQNQAACTRLLASGTKTESTFLSAPANEEWRAAQVGGTVGHGPLHLSGPYVPSPPGAVAPLFL